MRITTTISSFQQKHRRLTDAFGVHICQYVLYVYVYTTIHQLRASAFTENSKFLLLFLIVSAYLKNSIFLHVSYFIQKKGKT